MDTHAEHPRRVFSKQLECFQNAGHNLEPRCRFGSHQGPYLSCNPRPGIVSPYRRIQEKICKKWSLTLIGNTFRVGKDFNENLIPSPYISTKDLFS